MDRKDIDAIHDAAEKKMVELEESGLSREELLYDRDIIRGVPLF